MKLTKDEIQGLFNQYVPGFTVNFVTNHAKGGNLVIADGETVKGAAFHVLIDRQGIFIDCINADIVVG